MTSTFFAIPLPKQGESFLLRTTHEGQEKTIIVDVGWETKPPECSKGLYGFLQMHMPDLCRVDRLILTHQDADHCEGAPQFIKQWINKGYTISEVWLPAIWVHAGPSKPRTNWVRNQIVRGAILAVPEIVAAIHALSQGDHPSSGLSEYAIDNNLLMEAVYKVAKTFCAKKELFTARTSECSPPLPLKPQLEIDEGRENREGLFLLASKLFHNIVANSDFPFIDYFSFASKLVDGALDTHKRISAVIDTCVEFKIRIRWFDFQMFEKYKAASGGDDGFLTPVNAVEIVPVLGPISAKEFFYALMLSQANRECLSFLRHAEDDEPAVLFTGDSQLTTAGQSFSRPRIGLPARGNIIVTAMHHASASNEVGYGVLKAWLQNLENEVIPIFVRNGGYRVKNLAPEFLNSSDRLCVRCIDNNRSEYLVQVDSCNESWSWCVMNHPHQCTCGRTMRGGLQRPIR